jgi:hypothetical protein
MEENKYTKEYLVRDILRKHNINIDKFVLTDTDISTLFRILYDFEPDFSSNEMTAFLNCVYFLEDSQILSSGDNINITHLKYILEFEKALLEKNKALVLILSSLFITNDMLLFVYIKHNHLLYKPNEEQLRLEDSDMLIDLVICRDGNMVSELLFLAISGEINSTIICSQQGKCDLVKLLAISGEINSATICSQQGECDLVKPNLFTVKKILHTHKDNINLLKCILFLKSTLSGWKQTPEQIKVGKDNEKPSSRVAMLLLNYWHSYEDVPVAGHIKNENIRLYLESCI